MDYNTRQKIVQKDLNDIYDAVANCPVVLSYEITADASAGLEIGSFPEDIAIVDIVVQCTTANASGTVTISDGTNDISDAIACAVLDTIGRAGTIDATYSSISAGDALTVTTNGALDRGLVTVLGVRV